MYFQSKGQSSAFRRATSSSYSWELIFLYPLAELLTAISLSPPHATLCSCWSSGEASQCWWVSKSRSSPRQAHLVLLSCRTHWHWATYLPLAVFVGEYHQRRSGVADRAMLCVPHHASDAQETEVIVAAFGEVGLSLYIQTDRALVVFLQRLFEHKLRHCNQLQFLSAAVMGAAFSRGRSY